MSYTYAEALDQISKGKANTIDKIFELVRDTSGGTKGVSIAFLSQPAQLNHAAPSTY